MMSAIVDSLAI